MSPRPRSGKNRDLSSVPNLYRDAKGYYMYRDPKTGAWHGLGRDKLQAMTQAHEVNKHYAAVEVTLLDKITGLSAKTVKAWCDEYGKHPHMLMICNGPKKSLTGESIGLGGKVMERLEPLDIATWLNQWNDRLSMRRSLLSSINVILKAAIGKGYIKTNPAENLTSPSFSVKRERLSLDVFMKIYDHAKPPLKRAMELAIMTSARRENVIGILRADVKDGYLHVEHVKGGLKVRYPLSMHLSAVGWTLGDVIGRCRSNVVSKHLIHHVKPIGTAKPGEKYADKGIEQMFREARDAAEIFGTSPPTFHEIRSLAVRLWKAQGADVKTMAGHRSEESSALYQDSRGKDWVTISA